MVRVSRESVGGGEGAGARWQGTSLAQPGGGREYLPLVIVIYQVRFNTLAYHENFMSNRQQLSALYKLKNSSI